MARSMRTFGDMPPGKFIHPIALLMVGFLSGIPTTTFLVPRLLPLLPIWLNDLGCQIVIALVAGLAVGSVSYIVLCLVEELHPSRDSPPPVHESRFNPIVNQPETRRIP